MAQQQSHCQEGNMYFAFQDLTRSLVFKDIFLKLTEALLFKLQGIGRLATRASRLKAYHALWMMLEDFTELLARCKDFSYPVCLQLIGTRGSQSD